MAMRSRRDPRRRYDLIYQPTPAELNSTEDALLPVHEEMAARIGQPTIDAVYGAVGFQP